MVSHAHTISMEAIRMRLVEHGLEEIVAATMTDVRKLDRNGGGRPASWQSYRFRHPITKLTVTVDDNHRWEVAMPLGEAAPHNSVRLTWLLVGFGESRLMHVVKLYAKNLPSLAVEDASLKRVLTEVNAPLLKLTEQNTPLQPRKYRYEVMYAFENPVTKQKPVLRETDSRLSARFWSTWFSTIGDVLLVDHLTGNWTAYPFKGKR